MSRILITFASATSGVVILGALLSVAYMFNDINNFYAESLEDMQEFKVFFLLFLLSLSLSLSLVSLSLSR